MSEIWTRPRKVEIPEIPEVKPKFVAEFTTARLPRELGDSNNRNLSLIAKKTIQEGDTPPDTVGYLYLDENTQKVYYSAGIFNKPEYLFDWDLELSGGTECQYYNAIITPAGDIIFMRNRMRQNPIIYPADNYNEPYLIDFGNNLKPYAPETDTGYEFHPSGDYFILGEYTNHKIEDEENNDPRIIWKVTKPFDNPDNWQIKHSFKHVYFSSPVSDEPDREIGHIHTVVRDFYTGVWYCSTGDIDRHCRVWESIDEGETWHEVAKDKVALSSDGTWKEVVSSGQAWRAFGMIFTKDAAYWGTDAHGINVHALYKVDRNPETGLLDFSTITFLANLDLTQGQPQPTYNTCYMRDPHGLLFLDRAEPRSDHKLDLLFWSFKYNELFKLGTYNRIPNESANNRSGWGNQAVTQYQPTAEDGIILGAGSHIRRNKMDVLNNRITNRVGNMKIRIYEV